MSATAASSARPASAAIAWVTKSDLYVEIPSRVGPPYICRYPRTAEGLAAALNVLINHAERPSNTKARTSPSTHPAIRRPALTFDDDEREAARLALKKAGII